MVLQLALEILPQIAKYKLGKRCLLISQINQVRKVNRSLLISSLANSWKTAITIQTVIFPDQLIQPPTHCSCILININTQLQFKTLILSSYLFSISGLPAPNDPAGLILCMRSLVIQSASSIVYPSTYYNPHQCFLHRIYINPVGLILCMPSLEVQSSPSIVPPSAFGNPHQWVSLLYKMFS